MRRVPWSDGRGGTAAWLVLLIAAGLIAIPSLWTWASAPGYPGPLEYGEGSVAHAGQLIARGADPYAPQPPGTFVAAIYPPIAYLVAAVTLPLAHQGAVSFWVFAAFAVSVGFFNDLIMSPSWATAQDIGRRYSAIVSGIMNMVGNLGAVVGLFVSGQIMKALGLAIAVGDAETASAADE